MNGLGELGQASAWIDLIESMKVDNIVVEDFVFFCGTEV